MSEGGVPVYVVGEDQVHRALGMALVDAVISKLAHDRDADWVDPDTVRRWSALAEPPGIAENRRWGNINGPSTIRLHGRLDGAPYLPGARQLRSAVVEHARAERSPGLLVLLRDTDGDPEIARGAQQVRDWIDSRRDLPPTAIGCPHRDAEAWFFAASGLTGEEAQRLDQACRVLSFDPTRQPERLTSSPNDARTDAKRVVRFVLLAEGSKLAKGTPASRPPSPDQADALAERVASDLDQLASYDDCGLAPFVDGLKKALVVALDSHLPRAP